MIDTVRFVIDGQGFRAPDGWKCTQGHKRVLDELGERDSEFIMGEDPETGLRVGGATPDFVQWAEVSLPRLVKGRNSCVLTVDEVAPAVEALRDRLKACHVGELRIKHASRVDVCGQFEGQAVDWIAAHRISKHPRVRKASTEWFGQSLHWPGAEIHGRLYDKAAEEGKGAGNVMRMEWQLRGKALKKAFTGDSKRVVEADGVSGVRCYSVLRELTLPLQPVKLARTPSLASFLALVHSTGWRDPAGRDAVEVWTSGKGRTSVWRTRRDVARLRPEFFGIDWEELLPENPDRAPIIYDAWDVKAA